MALKKLITLQAAPFTDSQQGDYWVITRMETEKQNNSTRVELSLYESQEKSKPYVQSGEPLMVNSNPQPMYTFHTQLTGMDYTRETAYNAIKLLPQFINAEDC